MAKEDTQFKKGVSGNPNGRPKGTLGLKALIQQVWDEEIKDSKGNKKVAGLIATKAIFDKAAKGDVSAFKVLCERMEGLPKQDIELTNNITQMERVKINGKELDIDIG